MLATAAAGVITASVFPCPRRAAGVAAAAATAAAAAAAAAGVVEFGEFGESESGRRHTAAQSKHGGAVQCCCHK